LKLLFVSNLFPDKSDPIRGLDNANLLRYLKPHIDEISVIALRPTLPLFKKNWQARTEDADLNPTFQSVPYIPKIGSRWNHSLMASAIKAPVKNSNCDHILVSWLFPDGCAIAKVADVPFTMICQGSDAHAYLGNPIRKKFIIDAIGKSNAVITRSADLATRLENAGAARDKLHPVYNGVNTQLFTPKGDSEPILDPNARWLLFVGNFLPVKNPHLLLDAWILARKSMPEVDIRLAIIGSGPMEDEIRKKAANAGLSDALLITGRQPPREVAKYMRAADLLCLSSHNEGVPNVVLEAFSSGIPVISTDVGGISEVLNEPLLGKLVTPGNTQELAAAITTTLRSPSNTEEISRHAQRYSWQKAASAYFGIVNTLF